MATDASRVGWLYQARRVNSQTAGGGGALVTQITIPAGQIAMLLKGAIYGPVSSTTLVFKVLDEDGAEVVRCGSIAAGASRIMRLPSIGSATTADQNMADTRRMLFGPGEVLSFETTTAANTETLTVAIVMLLYNVSTVPTWSTTGSGGTPSLAANTISTEITPVVVNPP